MIAYMFNNVYTTIRNSVIRWSWFVMTRHGIFSEFVEIYTYLNNVYLLKKNK